MIYLKKLNKRKGKLCNRVIAAVVGSIFLVQTILPSAWAGSSGITPHAQGLVQPLVDLRIPAEFGSVDKTFMPESTVADKRVTPVIYIQDAHANPEAQKNISHILEILNQENRISGIGLEGAFGEVNPRLIRLFDEAQANNRMVDYLAGLGELTGAEIFGYQHALPIQGIDDPVLYEQSFENFIEVKKDVQVTPFLSELLKKQQEAERLYLSIELRDFVAARRQWSASGEDAAGYFQKLRALAEKKLGIDLAQAIHQFEQPNLVRLVKASEIEKQFNVEKTRMEMESLRKALRQSLPSGSERTFILNALKSLQNDPLNRHFLDSTKTDSSLPIFSVRHFFERLYELTQQSKLTLLNYPALLDTAGLAILQSEVDAAGLLKELEPLEKRLEAKLAKTPEAKLTLEQDHKRVLIEKLLTLSLSLADYRKVLSLKKEDEPLEKVVQGYDPLLPGSSPLLRAPLEALRCAEEFYHLAVARDELLAKKGVALSKKLSTKNQSQAVVLVAGGFHQAGLLKFFEANAIPYALITPRAGVTEGENFYERVMLGQNSETGFQAKAETLNPRVLLETQLSFRPEVGSSWRRPGVILGAILQGASGQNRSAVKTAFQRAERADFFRRVVSHEMDSGLEVTIPELGRTVRVADTGQVTAVVARASTVLPPLAKSSREWFSARGGSAFGGQTLFYNLMSSGALATGVVVMPGSLAADASRQKNLLRTGRSEVRQHPTLVTSDLTAEEELGLLEVFYEKLQREELNPGSEHFVKVVGISDQHGTIDKFDALILDAIRSVLPQETIPANFSLDPDQTLADQLAVFGVTLESLRELIFFHNLGDLMDRGPYGVKVFRRSRELIRAGLSSFIVGNHDLWEALNLWGMHLPWYEGFNFYGYSDSYDKADSDLNVDQLISNYHKKTPQTRTKSWWAQKLKEFTDFHQNQQNERWDALDVRINGELDLKKKRVLGTGLYAQVSAGLTPSQDKLWGELRGFNPVIKVDTYTGVRAAGQVSIVWWEGLLENFKTEFTTIQKASDFNPELPFNRTWQAAIDMIEKEVLPELRSQLDEKLKDITTENPYGQWWWRVFEAVNFQNYSSVEWWAKDWIYHKDWGTSVLNELNEEDAAHRWDAGNYLENRELQEIAEFYRDHFNLRVRDLYQTIGMHAFLPVDSRTGEFYFSYRGQEYRGKGSKDKPSVWDGLGLISKDVKDRSNTPRELYDALSLVNSWYADTTTEAKAPTMARVINKFGTDYLAQVNGVNRLLMGHVPFYEFHKLGEEKRGIISSSLMGGRFIVIDHGMGERFGSRGAYLSIHPRGVGFRGYEHDGASMIVNDPRTLKTTQGADGTVEEVLFENKGIPRELFFPELKKNVEGRLEVLRRELARRSEVRSMDGDAWEYLMRLPEDRDRRDQVRSAAEFLEGLKTKAIEYGNSRRSAGLQEGIAVRPLLQAYARKLPTMGSPRNISVIEELIQRVYEKYQIERLPLLYRAVFLLSALDSKNFPVEQRLLLDVLEKLPMNTDTLQIDPALYQRLLQMTDKEHAMRLDESILFRVVMNRFLLNLLPEEPRMLERQALIREINKELGTSGSGDLTQMVFLTARSGIDLVGYAFGLKNYRGIETVADLEARLGNEGIALQNKNLLFVGGAGDTDIKLLQWLRKKGMLKLIAGPADLKNDLTKLGVSFSGTAVQAITAESANDALWRMKNFRAIYTDVYGNAYAYGAIPYDWKAGQVKVEYRGRRGMEAIEALQYDVRQFFERVDEMPADTDEFRQRIQKELGEAFRTLERWSQEADTLEQRPRATDRFGITPKIASEAFMVSSPYDTREFDPARAILHIRGEPSSENAKAASDWWIRSADGGILRGDQEPQIGQVAQGTMMTHLLVREGVRTGVRYFADIAGRDVIEDVSDQGLSFVEREGARGMGTAHKVLLNLRQRLLSENTDGYQKLSWAAQRNGLLERANLYDKKIADTKRMQKMLADPYFMSFMKEFFDIDMDHLTEAEISSLDDLFDFLNDQMGFIQRWLTERVSDEADAPTQADLVRAAVKNHLGSGVDIARALLDPRIFKPEKDSINQARLTALAQLARSILRSKPVRKNIFLQQEMFGKIRTILTPLERVEEARIRRRSIKSLHDREVVQSESDFLHRTSIEIYAQMGRSGLPQLREYLEPAYSEEIRKYASYILNRGGEARSYFMNLAMHEGDAHARFQSTQGLNRLGKTGREGMLIFTHGDVGLTNLLQDFLDGYEPTFSELLMSSLYVPTGGRMIEETQKIEKGIDQLIAFSQLFSHQEFVKLLRVWGFSAVSWWAVDPDIRLKQDFFVPLYTVSDSLKVSQSRFVEAVRIAEERKDPEYTRQVLSLLMRTGDLSMLRGMVDLIVSDTSKSHLISFLIAQMKLIETIFARDSFVQEEISKILYSNLNANYYLLRKLASAIPHARWQTGKETGIRNKVYKLDSRYGHNFALMRILRLELHTKLDTNSLKLVQTALELLIRAHLPKDARRYWNEAEIRDRLKVFVPQAREDLFRSLQSLEAQRLGTILYQALPDKERLESFLEKKPLWGKTAFRETLEFQTAQELIELYGMVDGMYGEGRGALGAAEETRLDQEPVYILPRIRELVEERQSIKSTLLQPGVFNPEDESQVTKEVDYKRHIAERDWGYSTTGYWAVYREGRFELFEKDRGMQYLTNALFDKMIANRLPVLFEQTLRAIARLDTAPDTKLKLKLLPEEARKNVEEAFEGLAVLIKMMEMDGVATDRMPQLLKELRRPGLDLLQAANILDLIQEDIRLFLLRLMFEYGDYPKEIALLAGPEGVREEYRLAPERRIDPQPWAEQVQEAFLANTYAEERTLQTLKSYVQTLQEFLLRLPQDFYLDKPEEPVDEQNPLPLYTEKQFDSAQTSMRDVGAKGWELLAAAESGYPVPKLAVLGASLPQRVSLDSNNPEFRMAVIEALLHLERETGQAFPFDMQKGTEAERRHVQNARRKMNLNPDTALPLIISVRSGSFISMPGMMDTALNVPFDEAMVQRFLAQGYPTGFVYDLYRRFLYSYSTVHLGMDDKSFSRVIDRVKQAMADELKKPVSDISMGQFQVPDYLKVIADEIALIQEKEPDFLQKTPFERVLALVRDVYESWQSEAARSYRDHFGISDRFGTAVILQKMVYGNLDENSGTAVIDSSDIDSGRRLPFGRVKVGGQGLDLVSGTSGYAQPFGRFQSTVPSEQSFEETHPDLHADIAEMVRRYESQEGLPVTAEITWQDDHVSLLQFRPKTTASRGAQKQLEMPKDQDYQSVGRGIPVSANAAIGRLLNASHLPIVELIRAVSELRTWMNASGEEDLDIILTYDYFTDDDSGKLLKLAKYLREHFSLDRHETIGSIGIINSKIAESNHASLIALRLGYAYVGKVDTLRLDSENQILFNNQPVPQGKEGDIYSIDGHSPAHSRFSGQVIRGKLKFRYKLRSEVRTAASDVTSLERIDVASSSASVKIETVGDGAARRYETSPKEPVDFLNAQAVQQYLAQVYNTLTDVAREMSTAERTYHPHEVQVHDEVVSELYQMPQYRTLLERGVAPARLSSGFVDAMDLFRILAKLRGKTEIAMYPELKTPKHNTPEKIALVVDAKASDLEAAFFRDLIGNPDIAVEAVVGTTPVQLAATLNHSIYRRFLRTGDVRYDQKEGWIEILGRKIRVVKNEEEIKGDQWQTLGVRTFVATHAIRRRAEKIAAAVDAEMENGEAPSAPIRIIALENFNPFTGEPVSEGEPAISLGFLAGDMAVKMEKPQVLLRSALTDVPVRFLNALQAVVSTKAVQSATYAVNYSISPMSALPLDESGRVKSPTQNQIPVSSEWTSYLRQQMRAALKEAELPGKALQAVSMSSIPAMMGDRAEVTLNLRGQGINEFLSALDLDRSILRAEDDYASAEAAVRNSLLSQMNQGLKGSGFVLPGSREAVNTDTRFDRNVLVDAPSVQVTISQGADNKLQLSLNIPLVFNRDWQNSRHLTDAILEVARGETANERAMTKVPDLRLSPYGTVVEHAKKFGTLPPAALEIPETLGTLREKPLQIGVVGFAGQIGARLHVANDLNLNIAAAIGGRPMDIRNSFDDSIVGPFTSNGVTVPMIPFEFVPHEGDRIGSIVIGDGDPIILLKRYDDPRQIPWKQFGVEVVAETTGAFTDPTDPKSLLGHLEKARGNDTGAEAVILSAPFGKPKDPEKQKDVNIFPTVVFGVNDTQVKDFLERAETAGLPKILSNASCTTNCVATMTVFGQRLRTAVTKLIRDKYGLQHAELGDVELAPVTTVHALTNTQPGYRDALIKAGVESRHRAGPQGTLTKSGVSDAITQLNFSESDSFSEGATGFAVRVPIATSLALVPFIFKITGLDQETAEVLTGFNQKATRKAFQQDVVALYSQVGREMAADPRFRDAVAFGAVEDAITSEIVAGSGQMVIDAQQVHVLSRGDLLTVTANAWYDNVTNYAENFLRILRQMADVMPVHPETSAAARSEVRALFGWGKRKDVAVSDDLIRARLSTELALLEIEEGPDANVNVLLPMVRAVLEEYEDFSVQVEEKAAMEQQFLGTEEVLTGNMGTNSMGWTEGFNPLSADMWKSVEVMRKFPKIVGAGNKRSEVRTQRGDLEAQLSAAKKPISEALSRVTNLVDRWTSAQIARAQKTQLQARIESVIRILNDEEEEGDLQAALVGLMQSFRALAMIGEDPANVLEGVLDQVRRWESILVRIKGGTRSEVRLQAALEPQDRKVETLLTVAQMAAFNTVDPSLAAAFPNFIRWRLFGLPLSDEALSESAQLPVLRKALQNREGLSSSERVSETPKTVVLASINGQVPVVDLAAMQLGTGSRVVILDSRGSEPVVWNAYEGKLPKNVRVERGVFEGQRPDLFTLQAHLTEKGIQARDQASRAILVFPYVTENVLDDYSAIPLEDGLVVRSPRLARKSATLRFAFSYILGRGMLPAQLLKETPPDVFQVRVHQKSLSPAYVPLGSEGHFANWAVAFAAHELLESAA